MDMLRILFSDDQRKRSDHAEQRAFAKQSEAVILLRKREVMLSLQSVSGIFFNSLLSKLSTTSDNKLPMSSGKLDMLLS